MITHFENHWNILDDEEEMKSLSRAWLIVTPWTVACTRLLHPWDFLGKSTGVGCHFLHQGIFPTQGSNPGLPHCRQTLYHLSHQGSLLLLLCNGLHYIAVNSCYMWYFIIYHSVQFSCSVMSDSLRPQGLQQARLPCRSPIPGVYSNSCPLSQWCHPTILSSVVPFSSCLQSFPASRSFQMS